MTHQIRFIANIYKIIGAERELAEVGIEFGAIPLYKNIVKAVEKKIGPFRPKGGEEYEVIIYKAVGYRSNKRKIVMKYKVKTT